jgi:hypothetical protein
MASVVTDNLTVTSSIVQGYFLKAFKSKLSVVSAGAFCIGKSEVVSDITSELGGHMIDLRMAQMEPADIRGILLQS